MFSSLRVAANWPESAKQIREFHSKRSVSNIKPRLNGPIYLYTKLKTRLWDIPRSKNIHTIFETLLVFYLNSDVFLESGFNMCEVVYFCVVFQLG